MKRSDLFTKTRKEDPKDEVAKNARLLIRAGFIHKEMAGVYAFLPLGVRVLEKIKQIIREEVNKIGGQELFLTALQDKELWEKTNRWDDSLVDNWFKTQLKSGGEVGLGITHEEPLTRLMKDHISSYRDLPIYTYQFQTKFRNEMRAKSGIMRGREFLMKDLYSFSKTEAEHNEFYAKVREAYRIIFNRLGLGDKTYVTFASGGIFSRFSEEFQTVSEAGEDIIYVDEAKGVAVNKEVFNDEVLAELGLDKQGLVEKKAIEVGNIFNLGTKFSEPLELNYKNEAGENVPVVMGSYGIGPSRLLGTIVEVLADEKGMVWPEAVAPFRVYLVSLGNDEQVLKTAQEFYQRLNSEQVEVLYDDREAGAGEKLGDADLMGLPYIVVIGNKFKDSGEVEVTKRATGEVTSLSLDQAVDFLKK